jgi:hypothetical protein
MVHQEFKSKYSITEHVVFKKEEEWFSGIIAAVKFRFRSTSYDIVDDETNELHKEIPASIITGTISPEYLTVARIPSEIELENNLFTDIVGDEGKLVKSRPISIFAPPHISFIDGKEIQ